MPGKSSNVLSTPREKRLRSNTTVEISPIDTPSSPKWRSPRRCNSANGEIQKKESNCSDNTNIRKGTPKSARKRLSDLLVENPKWNPRDPTQMRVVKEALHVSTCPVNVICRDKEQQQILEFCKDCVEHEKPGSLYVCGCPGTGKTLSINNVKEQLLVWSEEVGFQPPDFLFINCTLLTKTSEIFCKMSDKFQLGNKRNTDSSALQHLQKFFSQKKVSSRKMMLIVIDEMDYLVTKDRMVLNDLFMLTTLPFSNCILIGISNAIDLADRFLPKLKSLNCKPIVVTFPAYTKDQIVKILEQRIASLGYDAFWPLALEFCARKVSAASGDMRRALDACRSAIDILEAELRHSTTKQEIDMVTFEHMNIALSKAFKSPILEIIQSLPQHQQIILCSMAILLSKSKKKSATLCELNLEYSFLCKSNQIPVVGILEFTSMCNALSDQGVFQIGKAKDSKKRILTLQVETSDINCALKGIRFFKNCLGFQ